MTEAESTDPREAIQPHSERGIAGELTDATGWLPFGEWSSLSENEARTIQKHEIAARQRMISGGLITE